MKVVTLLENTACDTDLRAAHGLSLYMETPRHRILFDMGPDEGFLDNAEKLGVDLGTVDIAILSHGHYDHGGGLAAFCACNDHATLYLRPGVFGSYYAVRSGEAPKYIGLDPSLRALEPRIVFAEDYLRLDEELMLFSDVPVGPMATSAKLQEQTAGGFQPDPFFHEQNLLVIAEGTAVLLAGCAHRGIAGILKGAEHHLGRRPDVVFGGFHFFELDPEDPSSATLIAETATALLAGKTVYYTGHCTGAYAYEQLHTILQDRLRPMTGGAVVKL